MGDKRDTEHNHAQSLAYLNANAAVSNYEVPSHPQHVSQNPSDLQNVIEAQIVSKNKDNYIENEEQPNELTSGPPKKFIDNPQKEPQAMPLSNFAHSAMQQNKLKKAANNDVLFGDDNNETQQQSNDNANDDIF